MHRSQRVVTGLAACAVALAACSGGGGGDRSSGITAGSTTVASTTTVPSPATQPDTTEPPTTDAAGTTTPPVADPAADWTVLLYVMGDNDLEPFAVDDLLEMSRVGSTDDVNIVALVDRHPEYQLDDDPLGDDDGSKLYLVGDGEFRELADIDEVNVGSPETLADFIEIGITSFPAAHYGVVLWDHGAGWPGMGPDETDGNDILDLAEIDAAFTAGLAAAGVEQVDIVGFDACLMASYEVATTMSDHAAFMLASEELEPGHGWNYEALRILTENPGSSAEELGRGMIEGFAAQAEASGTATDITLSLLDLSAVDDLEAALGELAAPLMDEPTLAAPLLARAQADAQKFGANPDPDLDTYHVDLGGVVASLGQADPVLTDPAGTVIAALDRLVVSQTTGPATAASTGLSIYFPPFADRFRQGYLFLEDIAVWPDLLQSFFTAGDGIPQNAQPEFLNTDGQADYFFDEDGLNIFGTFDLAAQGNLVDASIFYGVLDEEDGSIIYIGEEDGEVSDDGSGLAGAIYDLTVLTISDGVDTDYAYLDLTFDPESGLGYIDVPLWYVPPEELTTDDPPHDVVLSLVLDQDGTILSEVYYEIGEDGTFGELTADPDGLIFPIVLNEYPDGSVEWLTLSEQGLFANLPDLQYDLEPLDPGTGLYAELVLTDYGGNTASVSMFDVVP
jgi:hypothetical protein